jgi:hypothetical protein
MMAEYPTPPGDGMAPIVDEFRKLARRISELERPSGTSIGSLVAQVQAALVDLNAAVIAATDNYLSSGTVNVTNLTASGTLNGVGGVKSVDVYNRLVSGSPYKVQYVDSSGQMGYVPSSRRYKRDIVAAELDVRTIMANIRVVTFRYINAVASQEYVAPTEWGVIAEEIHDLGLTWLVDYNEKGQPDGVKHERFAILLIMNAQEQQSQIDDLDARLSSIGG